MQNSISVAKFLCGHLFFLMCSGWTDRVSPHGDHRPPEETLTDLFLAWASVLVAPEAYTSPTLFLGCVCHLGNGAFAEHPPATPWHMEQENNSLLHDDSTSSGKEPACSGSFPTHTNSCLCNMVGILYSCVSTVSCMFSPLDNKSLQGNE